MDPQSKRGQKLKKKKKTIEHYKGWFSKHPKSSFYVVLFLLEF